MRVTRTEMVEKEITTYSCDICGHSTEHNSGCCGHSTIMSCDFCGQDCCRDHRESFWEKEWEDYPDMTICSDCLPKGRQAWEIAMEIAGRYDSMYEVAKKVFENFEDYKYYLDED
jgi:hypothetical protein